jgi:HEPN domain-containing protein
MNRTDLQQLANLRFREARSLLDTGFSDGAYYMAGYSVECALKACIAKRTEKHDFPDKKLVNESHTHSLIELLRLSELAPLMGEAIQTDGSIENRWIIVRGWSEASRYQRSNGAAAEALLQAIEDDSGGILPWIRLHW